MNAQQIANQLFETNQYQTMKNLELEKKAIEKILKDNMGEDKRKVHHSTGTVMKFIANNSYDNDNIKINETLQSYGILIHTTKFGNKTKPEVLELIQNYKNENEYYVKINAKFPKEEFNFESHTTKELITRWNEVQKELKLLKSIYNDLREQMNECSELQVTNKLKFDFGSISRVKKETSYNMEAIYNEFGPEFIIENATPVYGEIDKYIEEGYLTISEIEKHKKITNVSLKYVVTTLKEEEKLFNMLNQKTIRASLNREELRKQVR